MSTSKETVSKVRNKTKKRGVGIYMKNAIARKVHLPFCLNVWFVDQWKGCDLEQWLKM